MIDYSMKYLLSTTEQLLIQKYQSSALSVSDVASELQVETSDVEFLLNNGELSCKSIGSKKRILIASLLDYMFNMKHDLKTLDCTNKHKVNDLLATVLESKKENCKKLSSYKWYCTLANHIKNDFEGEYIEDLSCTRISSFFKKVSVNKAGILMSHKFMVAITQIFKNVIKVAMTNKYIIDDPFENLKNIPYGKAKNPRLKFIPNSVVVKLLQALDNSITFKPMVTVMLRCGLRIGEVLALRWSDLDEEDGIIRVEQSLSIEYDEDDNGNLINKRYEIGETKTICSVRDVAADKEVFKELRKWRSHIFSNKKLVESIFENGNEDLIFVTRFGKSRSYQALQKSFRRFLKSNGMGNNHITFHMLRHTYASLLQNSGVDLNVIKELLGHADIMTTANIYVNVDIEPKRIAADLLHQKLSSLIGS